MTGFGKAIGTFKNKKITVEAKSVNSKQFDLNLKVPNIYKDKELEIRNDALRILARGKIDICMYAESNEAGIENTFNSKLVKSYFLQLKNIAKELNVKNTDDLLSIVLRMPDVQKAQPQEPGAMEWKVFNKTYLSAINNLDISRSREGKILEKDIVSRIKLIGKLLKQVGAFEKQRMENIKIKLRQSLTDHIKTEAIDNNRFEQELIYYLEKIDITEEKVRLDNHLKYFLDTVKEEMLPGKKLGFISQEIGREINTLGSKANESNLQKIVIRMKDELEKIKEQLLNIL